MKHLLPKIALAGAPQLSFELPDALRARWDQGLRANKEEDNTISILDVIGQDWFGDGVTAKRISAALRTIGKRDVVVNINSPGGDVFEGIAIYNLLRDHEGEVTVRVLGSAFSAASIIAMAGDTIQVARAGFLMIHNAWGIAVGDKNALRETADVMEQVDGALADVYAARSDLPVAELREMMNKETWFSGEAAIEQGLADEFLPADQVEKQDDKDKTSARAAMRRVDELMAKGGVPRSERRSLLRQLGGTPSAAADTMPGAGEEEDARKCIAFLSQYTY